MLYMMSFGSDLTRTLDNVELVEATTKLLTITFRVGESTKEAVERLLLGEREEHAINHSLIEFNSKDDEEGEAIRYYGYTKMKSYETYDAEDPNDGAVIRARVTLRKPTVDELAEDIYYGINSISGMQNAIIANVGGSYGDITADTTALMLAQLGGV